jgi:hypothetical protein
MRHNESPWVVGERDHAADVVDRVKGWQIEMG